MAWLLPPSKLYKYLPLGRIDVLERLKVRFTPPSSFNDPFDCRGPARSVVDEHLEGGGLQLKLQRMDASTRQRFRDAEFALAQLLDEHKKTQQKEQDRQTGTSSLTDRSLRLFDHPLTMDLSCGNPKEQFVFHNFVYGGRGWMEGPLSPSPEHPISILGGYEKQRMFNQVGVLSLSARESNPVMWSHYAESHRGLVIGLSTRDPFFERDTRSFFVRETGSIQQFGSNFPDPLAFGIPSEKKLVVPPTARVLYDDVRTSASPFSPGEASLRNDPDNEVLDFSEMLFKAEDWSYEQEWRMFRRLQNECSWDSESERELVSRSGFRAFEMPYRDLFGMPVVLFDLPPSCITEVIMGINMPVEGRREIAAILQRNPLLAHVELKSAVSNPVTYRVDSVSTDPVWMRSGAPTDIDEYRRQSDFREAIQYWPDALIRCMLDKFQAGRMGDVGLSNDFGIEALLAEMQARTRAD